VGRIARAALLYDGCFAHVFTRAIERRKIFEKSEDFQFFKNEVLVVKKEYSFKVFHYCLMQTHVHMVVAIKDASRFSEGMKVLKKSYTHQYNVTHKRVGPLWRDRYRAKLIENESYLKTCGNYVEYNPVEAGIVERAVDWPYSSSRHYQMGERDLIVDLYDYHEAESMPVWRKDEFEEMKVIGSDWFQFQIHRKLTG